MEEEKIDVVKAWPKSKSVWDIKVFIGFANFNRRCIQGFSKITAPLISMLKIGLQPVGALLATSIDDSKVVGSSGRNDRKLAKSDFTKPMQRAKELSFLTLDARQVFTQLS